MLRTLLVLGLVAWGGTLALRDPFYALLFYVWNAYFRPESWVWDQFQGLILALNISFTAGLLAVATSITKRRKFQFNFHVGLLLLFLLHTLTSTLVGEHVDYCWTAWRDFLKAMTITYLMAVLVDDAAKLRLTALIMALSLGFEGAKQGWAELVVRPGSMNSNEIPFLGDNNGVAVGMLMLVPLFGTLIQTTTKKWPKQIYRFLTIGVFYRAITTYSRGGFLASGALGVIYWLRSKNKIRLLIGMGVVVAIVLPVMPDAFWDRMGTIQTYEEVDDSSALSRLHFWKVAVSMANSSPIFGVGFSGYNPSYNKYDFSFGVYGGGRSVHSVWFGVLGELGYAGLGLYILILLCAFRNCQRARKIAAKTPELASLGKFATSIETSLTVFVVGGTFLPFQYNEMLWHMIGLSLALRLVAEKGPAVQTAPAPTPGFAAAPGVEPTLALERAGA